ncbi:NLR family CARD domain-containing protein 4 isoform X3 [Lepisosteus oculatus]|uniref:NLR family CARD domain-containing protein 4 isoform X3 n=1 Tax=Lepisosteus oculatus TaxID=7918 RepID=UPI0007404EF6|nr:PREDICTED: NLR family CARD domain-containing protein 4 isoform X3 [Lepisosteus oculatus]
MDFIRKNYVELIERMGITITHQIADHIYSKSVIDLEEKDEIYCEKTGPKAARKIIDLIQQKGEKACRLFVDCLRVKDVFLFEDLLGRWGLLEGIQNLQNLEKLNLINIKMAEDDAKQLAEGVKHLQRLQELHLAKLEGIGNGLRFIIDAATSRDCCLKKMVLVNCCLTKEAVIILAENLRNANKLESLDLFENQLEEDASGCVEKLIDKLRALPSLQTLMLPWGQNVKDSLSKLLDFLKNLPGLQKLGLQSWHLTDKDLELLSSSIQNGHLRDLQHLDLSENCVSSQGWHRFLGALGMLKKLRVMDLSSKEGMQPEPRLINDLGKLIFELSALRRVGLQRWHLDKEYLKCLNKGNVVFGREFQLLVSSDYIEEDETDEESHM